MYIFICREINTVQKPVTNYFVGVQVRLYLNQFSKATKKRLSNEFNKLNHFDCNIIFQCSCTEHEFNNQDKTHQFILDNRITFS